MNNSKSNNMRKVPRILYLIQVLIGLLLVLSSCSDNKENVKTLSGKSITKSDIDTFIINQMDSLNIKGL